MARCPAGKRFEASQKRLRSFIRSSQAYHESAPHLPSGNAAPFAYQKPSARSACASNLQYSLGSLAWTSRESILCIACASQNSIISFSRLAQSTKRRPSRLAVAGSSPVVAASAACGFCAPCASVYAWCARDHNAYTSIVRAQA
eukprot:2916098-Pyramimonas_sp.AAC.2